MLSQRTIEMMVGIFLLLALIALTTLAFKVSGLTSFFPKKSYLVTASFDDIGGLKVRAPVKIGGVQIGEVLRITLDPTTFKAIVHMRIDQIFNDIPDDSTAGILTAGLLGDNYIAITPMYNQTFLKNGSEIQITRSAMVLEKLIGQFIYKIGSGDKESVADKEAVVPRESAKDAVVPRAGAGSSIIPSLNDAKPTALNAKGSKGESHAQP